MSNNQLSDKQIHILKLIVEHGGYKETARAANIGEQAIKETLLQIRKKMNVRTTYQAVHKATKEGLI